MLGSDDTIVVVGGGAGGHACCRAYREAGGEAPVLMLSADDRLPYFRPHVTKDYLVGALGADDLSLSDAEWYVANGVEVLLDCEVTALDLGARLAATSADPVRWVAACWPRAPARSACRSRAATTRTCSRCARRLMQSGCSRCSPMASRWR